MKDRFKFRAVMKTDELCIVVPVEAVHNTYYIIDMNVAKEIFDKKYPEKCFFSDFLEIIEKQEDVSQYASDCASIHQFKGYWNDNVYPLSQLYFEYENEEFTLHNLEIIGNIYENPELLKGVGNE